MTQRLLFVSTLALIAAGALRPSAARAQESLAGSWQLAGSSAEAAQRQAAIEASTEELSSFIRSRVRKRLSARTTPPPRIRIAVTGDRVKLTGSGQTLSLTIGGPSVTIEHEGSRGQAQATRRNGHLVIAIRGNNGVRTTTYRLSKDLQGLVLDVHLTGDRLSTPVRYRVTYKRV